MMNHKLRKVKTHTSIDEFTSKLFDKWKRLTLITKPPLPQATGDSLEELESILRQLVAIPTTTGNKTTNRDALDYIERFLSKRGMYTVRHEWNGIESLVATTRRTKKPTVFLGAHLDVVPGPQEMFELKLENGIYRGRGTLDMKFAIASYMQLVEDLRKDLDQYDFGIMITTDEEAGGMDGVQNLVEAGYIPKVCILPDGGDNWQVQTYSKGFLYMTISIEGSPAHGSRPWLGDNAIVGLIRIIDEIQKFFPGQHADSNTINFGKIQGGEAINQVAQYAEVSVDCRFISEEAKTKMILRIQQLCDSYGAKLNILLNGSSTSFDLDNPYIKPFTELITKTTGTVVTGSRTLGSNDLRYFTPYNVPCISVYPTGGGHHGPNEWISKEGVQQFYEILKKYTEQTAFKSTRSGVRR